MKRRLASVRRALQVLRTGFRYFVFPAGWRRPAVPRAERARAALEELGGAWVKLGQALALRFDILPADYCIAFFRLLGRMRPFPEQMVRRLLEDELGRPVEQLFPEFDFTPIAAASVGQVHRARLPDGTTVAVKLQRPEIRGLLRADLALMRAMATVADLLPWVGRSSARGLVREFASWTEEELDFRTEAHHVALLRRNAAGDPWERHPRVHASHTTSRVLTVDYLDGIPVIDIVTAVRTEDAAFLRQLAARGHDRRRIASHIVWNALNQIYRQGCFHADPHPANLIVLPGDAIGYVDFGIIGQLDRETTDALRTFAQYLFDGQTERAVLQFERFLVPSRRTDRSAARRDLAQALSAYVGSPRVTPGGLEARTLFEIEMLAVVRRHRMSLAPAAARYLKAVLTAEATVKELDPHFDLMGHENRFFTRLAGIEAADALAPRNLVRLALDARRWAGELREMLARASASSSRSELVERDVRQGVQILIGAAVVLTVLALVFLWIANGEATFVRSTAVRIIAVLLAVFALVEVLRAIRRLRRPPRNA